jgi:hypothetical protein
MAQYLTAKFTSRKDKSLQMDTLYLKINKAGIDAYSIVQI